MTLHVRSAELIFTLRTGICELLHRAVSAKLLHCSEHENTSLSACGAHGGLANSLVPLPCILPYCSRRFTVVFMYALAVVISLEISEFPPILDGEFALGEGTSR
jgi:hypothetical protein